MNPPTYPVGAVLVHNVSGIRYRVIESPAWMRPGNILTIDIDTGRDSVKDAAAVAKFYRVES